jgi:hypothetical protein
VRTLAGVCRALGVALGPENEDTSTLMQWASELDQHARNLGGGSR